MSDLALSANRLKAVPFAALQPLKGSLGTLDLGENVITDLPDKWLAGFAQLYGLRLADNHLSNLTSDVFIGAQKYKNAKSCVQQTTGHRLGNVCSS